MSQYPSLNDYIQSINKPKRREAISYLMSGVAKGVAEIDDCLFNMCFQSDDLQWVEVTLSEDNILLEDSHCFICGSKDCIHSIAACLCVAWMLKLGLSDLEISSRKPEPHNREGKQH